MYPDYKQQAIESLTELFARLASRQFGNPLFSEDGMIDLGHDSVFPLWFSTRDVINISNLIADINPPLSRDAKKWISSGNSAVMELAQKAEQHEYDDPMHLLHTMMNLHYVCKNGDAGWLSVRMDEDGMTVFLTEQLSGKHLLEDAEEVNVIYNDKWERFKIMEVAACYVEETADWRLTFKAIRLKTGEEVELKNEDVSPNVKKVIADWMIRQARLNIHCVTELEQQEDGQWTAPRKGLQVVDRVKVLTAINGIVDCNSLTVEVGTNGRQGGDTGHGCRTYLRIKNDASTDMNCRTAVAGYDTDADGRCQYYLDTTDHGHVDQIEIMLGGDSELDTFIEALEFAVDVLRKQRDGQLATDISAVENDKE